MKGFSLVLFTFLCTTVYGGKICEIKVSGNKHTKEHIILRELTFKLYDDIFPEKYKELSEQSQNNLLNTSLFNFATVSLCDSLDFTKVSITVVERWYIWPEVLIKFQDRNFTEWLRNRNFSRIDYGIYVSHLNFRGRQEKLQLQFRTGFNKKIGLLYRVPYLTSTMKAGLSIGLSYNTQNEVFTSIDDQNKMVYTKNPEKLLFERYNVHVEYKRRNNLYLWHYLMADYQDLRLKNDLQAMNESYFNGRNNLRFFVLTYMIKDDHRDSKNYPLNGYYADLEIKQNGIGIDKSELNITRIKGNYRKYFFLRSRWYFSFGSYAEAFSSKDIPFFLQDGLGFNRYVRGYEPYVIFGQYSGTLKANLKYQLVTPKSFTVPLIKSEKFSKVHFSIFNNIFIDGGYVHNKINNLKRFNNDLLLAAGTGLDFVTFYDLVWRFEYSINKYKEHGFYISFVAPI